MMICDDKDCFGCGACHDICPVDAISLSDKQGFWRPIIDEEKCVKCGKCRKVCTALLQDIKRDTPKRSYSSVCYAGWSNDDRLHLESASGGIATELAKAIIKKGGIVAGVTFDGDKCCARHIVIERIEDLQRLAKSKYVLSNKTDIYKTIKERIISEKMVLYVGTGCEVNAMYHFLKTENVDLSRFYTIDLLCRGGASSKCLREHTEFCANNKQISTVAFRGGRYDCMYTVYSKNGKLIYRSPQY